MNENWGSLAVDARALTGGGGRRCHVARLLDGLDDQAKAAVVKALKNRDLSASALEKAFVDRVGRADAPSQWSIGNHRRGACKCDR